MAALGRLANKTDKTISASGKGRLWFFRPAAVIAREYALSAKSRQHAASNTCVSFILRNGTKMQR